LSLLAHGTPVLARTKKKIKCSSRGELKKIMITNDYDE